MVLADGTRVRIRELGPVDHDDVRALHEALSAENLYMRFFSINRNIADNVAGRICQGPGPGCGALGAWVAGELVAVANCMPTGTEGVGEIAIVVAEHMRRRGIATLLLHHLGPLARTRGVREFHADTLAENYAVQRLLAASGLPLHRHGHGAITEVDIPLQPRAQETDAPETDVAETDVAETDVPETGVPDPAPGIAAQEGRAT